MGDDVGMVVGIMLGRNVLGSTLGDRFVSANDGIIEILNELIRYKL